VICHILCTDNYKFHNIVLTLWLTRSSNRKTWSSINAPHLFPIAICVLVCILVNVSLHGEFDGGGGWMKLCVGVVSCIYSQNYFNCKHWKCIILKSSLNGTNSNLCFPILGVVTVGEGRWGRWVNRHFACLSSQEISYGWLLVSIS